MIAHVRRQFNKISGTVYYDPLDINSSSVELVIDFQAFIRGYGNATTT
jgi:polyisoprenoid-binding protein YceI